MEFKLTTRRTFMWGKTIKFYLNAPIVSPPNNGWPLLLFLHGFRTTSEVETEKWLRQKWLSKLRSIPHLRRCVVLTPVCPRSRWWVSSSIASLVSEVQKNPDFTIDSSRVYAIGYSMGAFCTWGMMSKYPSLFAASVPIAGGGKPDGRTAMVVCNTFACTFPLSLPLFYLNVCHGTDRTDFVFEDLEKTVTFVWAFHSKNDIVIPYSETVRNVEKIPSAQARITLYSTLNHEETFDTVISNLNVFNWIFSKRLSKKSAMMNRD